MKKLTPLFQLLLASLLLALLLASGGQWFLRQSTLGPNQAERPQELLAFAAPEFNLPQQAQTLSLLTLFSFLLLGTCHLLHAHKQAKIAARLLAWIEKTLADTATEAESTAPIPGFPEEISKQLRILLTTPDEKNITIGGGQAALPITQKISLYTKKRFELIFEEFPDGIMLLNESAEATYANSKIEIILGKSKSEVIGHKFHDWSQEEVLTDFFSRFQNIQSRLRRKKELLFSPSYLPERTLSVGAYPVENRDNNTFLGTLVLFRDVSAEALAKQARGDFVSHVSHELKSPLNVLKMYSELLLNADGNDKEIERDAANVISDEVERLSLLINNLLSISKIELGSISLVRQRVKVVDLLSDAFQTIARSGLEERLSFKLDLPQELSPLSLDKELFRVAINNLLTNAIKYNRPQGKVTLAAEENDAQIIISVKDTGLGIAAGEQEHIFEKFYRSESAEVRDKPGHGLGLALAKNIVELHHGKLKLESTLGEGSTFAIVFDKGSTLVQEGL